MQRHKLENSVIAGGVSGEVVGLIARMEGMLSSSWVYVTSAVLLACLLVLKVAILLWWRPRKMEEHFAKQGIRGPPYRFFIGNFKEIVSLMRKAASQPMTHSHNILPRVLSFYHHWKKIYGNPDSPVPSVSPSLISPTS